MRISPAACSAAAGVLLLVGISGCTDSDGTAPSPTPAAGDTAGAPYRDASLPVDERVDDLLARMSLADKVGQMTQAERGSVSPADVTELRLGSVLSGGGSAPPDNTPAGWADMIDGLQAGASATPLGIPCSTASMQSTGTSCSTERPCSHTTSAWARRAIRGSPRTSHGRRPSSCAPPG